jgi:hypothetical protein
LTLAFATVSQAALPDGPNKDLVETKCGACHDTSLLMGNRLSLIDWRTKVQIMVGLGAQVTPKEQGEIVNYLNTYLGLKPPPKK